MVSKATSHRLLWILFVSQSLFSAAQIAVFTLIAIIAVRLSGTESVSGLPTSTLIFAQALAAYPIAAIMGRFGRRIGLVLGFAAGALGGLVGMMAIINSVFPLLLVSAALIGVGSASSQQARFAAGELFPEAERARMIGRIVFAGTVGAVGGPVLVTPSSRFMESLGLHPDLGPWLVLTGLCVLAGLIIFLLLRPDPMRVARAISDNSDEKPKNQPAQPARSLLALLMVPKVQLAILAALISQTVMVVLMAMTPLYMDHNHHGRDTISLVIAMHTLGMFGLSPLTGYLVDRFGRIATLIAGGGILIAATLLAPVSTNQYILSVALFLLGLGWNFGFVAGSTLLSDALQGEERAQIQGLNDALVAFAAGIGSLGAGSLFASGGYAAISMAGLVLVVVLIVLIVWLGRPRFAVPVVE